MLLKGLAIQVIGKFGFISRQIVLIYHVMSIKFDIREYKGIPFGMTDA